MKDLKIFTENIEQEALDQINLLLEQEAFKDSKVRIMPDVHSGKGCVIGFTADLGDKVVPNLIGVDIGCGMLTINLGNIDIDLEKLDQVIRENIPSGFNVHEGRSIKFPQLKLIKCYRELNNARRIEKSIGTLGGGNHFIEVGKDEEESKYLVIHTGSRNLGKQVAEHYQNLADKLCNYNYDEYLKESNTLIEDYKAQGRKSEIQKALKELPNKFKTDYKKIPKDLAYLEGKYRDEYLYDMNICKEFSTANRHAIADIILKHMQLTPIESFETIHNYIDTEDNIVRKGAISAKKGEILLIPINMRDGCIIGKGKGNPDWNQSAPHGAGRLMSRRKAKENISFDDFKKTMEGIYSTSVNKDTLDEAPFAYKPMDEIMNNIEDTVDIIKIIKPIYNFKAGEKTD